MSESIEIDVVIYPEGKGTDKTYSISSMQVPNVVTQGSTIEEAKKRLLEDGKTFVSSDTTSLVVAERLPDVISDTSPAKVIRMAVIIKKEEVVVSQIEQPKGEEPKIYSFGPLPLDKAA